MDQKLPPHASLELLRKRAKARLRELRAERADAKLSDAQFELARAHGFSSWRALKQHVDRERAPTTEAFFKACDAGELEAIRRALDADSPLVHERHSHQGRTALHRAAIAGKLDVARLLLERGADPNARDECDRAYPHHYAAEQGELEIVRACLDHGGDLIGDGDVHELGVLGWALCTAKALRTPQPEIAQLLLERGARHHVFSAIAANEPAVLEALLEDEPDALERRLSRFEHAETPLHFAARCGSREIVELLLRLGADLDAVDDRGRTPLAAAVLAQRSLAAEALRAAGAREPERAPVVAFAHATPILPSHDVRAAIAYYQAQLGFQKRWEWGEPTSFACVARDDVTIFLGSSEHQGPPGVGVFIDVEAVDALHREYQRRGAKIREAPQDRPWGSREMVVEDLDGNKLRLAT